MDWTRATAIVGGAVCAVLGLSFARKALSGNGSSVLPGVPEVLNHGVGLPEIKCVPAKWFTATPAGTKRDIKWIVIHDAEFPETITAAEGVAAFFAAPGNMPDTKNPDGTIKPGGPRKVSAHYTSDSDSIVQSVKDNDVAYAAPPANDNGLHLELAGYAKQSAADWDDPYSHAELELAAKLVAAKCIEYGIPPVGFLTPEELLAGKRGITSHWNVSKAWKKSDHQDPGPNFPYDKFIAMVQKYAGAAA